MNNSIATLLLVTGLAVVGTVSVRAATSVPFGPWTSAGDSGSGLLEISAGSGVVEFSVSFSASGTFRPVEGTPNNTLETYSLKYALVTVSLTSANGFLSPDPVFVTLNDVAGTVDYLTPVTGTPADWGDIPYTLSLVSGSVQVPYSGVPAAGGEEFTVSWTSLSALSATGGKGIEGFTENPQLSAMLNVVPEPSQFVLGGVGLLLLSALRLRQR